MILVPDIEELIFMLTDSPVSIIVTPSITQAINQLIFFVNNIIYIGLDQPSEYLSKML